MAASAAGDLALAYRIAAGPSDGSRPLGRTDDRPGPEENAGDRIVTRCREVRLPGCWQVVGQQPPRLLGRQAQPGHHRCAWLGVVLPSGLGGDKLPGPGDRARDGDRDGVTGPGGALLRAVGVGPAQPVEYRSGQVGAQVTGAAECLRQLLAVDPLFGELAALVEGGAA